MSGGFLNKSMQGPVVDPDVVESNKKTRQIAAENMGYTGQPGAHRKAVQKSTEIKQQKEREENQRVQAENQELATQEAREAQARQKTTQGVLGDELPSRAVYQPPTGPDGKPVQYGTTVNTQVSQTHVSPREETLQREEVARQAAFEAAKEESRVRSQYAGMAADLTEEVLAQVQEADDEVAQLWETSLQQQEARLNQMQEMVTAARERVADPTAFFTSQGEAAGFGAAAAIATGHLASALGGGPNTALKVIDSAIERNLRAQEFNIAQQNYADQQQINLMDRWNAITKDKIQARLMAKHSLIQQMEFQMTAQAQRMEGDMAGVQLKQVQAALLTQKAQLMRQVDLLNKRVVNTQIRRVLPLAAQQRDQRMMAQQSAFQPSSAQGYGGAQTTLISALGRRGTFDAQGQSPDGVPNTLDAGNSPLSNEEMDSRVRFVGAREIYDQAYQSASPNLSDEDRQRAAAQAVIDAGNEEANAIAARQEAGEQFSDAQLKQMYEQSDVLQASVRDWTFLRNDATMSKRVPVADMYFNVNEYVAAKITKEKYSENVKGLSSAIPILRKSEKIRQHIQDIGTTKLSGVVRKADGSIDWDKVDKDTRHKLEEIKSQLLGMVNLARVRFGGGAINGAGEWRVFERLTHQDTYSDSAADVAFGDWLFARPDDRAFLGAYDVMMQDAQEWFTAIKNESGLFNSADMYRQPTGPNSVSHQMGR